MDFRHKRYRNYGQERDEDLIALCKDHHGAFHAKHGVQCDMSDETDSFVQGALFEEQAVSVMQSI